MPAWMPIDTRKLLGENAEKCESRSLFMDRFAQPNAKDTERKKWFELLAKKKPAFIRRPEIMVGAGQPPLYAQVQSRLMVNMAGGVMENAGLCLDRFGLPYIPGSATKGCARRMALQHLSDTEGIGQKVELLVQIALAFGWGGTDWKAGRKPGRNGRDGELYSDFEFACGAGESWRAARCPAAEALLKILGINGRRHPKEPWDDLPNFAGSVSFLPAQPVDVFGANLVLHPPAMGLLELDVVTCHHPDYYSLKKDRAGKLVMPVALDNEDPNPVIFPAVAAGHVFAFAVLPLRNCAQNLAGQARQWLRSGLSTFGLGAKTAAGYGWFDCSEELQQAVNEAIRKREERKQTEAAAADLKAKEEADHKMREAQNKAIASLSPEKKEDFKVGQFSGDQFRSALDNFAKKSGEEQKAIIRALRLDRAAAGSRRSFWDDLKAKAQKKGGRLAQTEQAIRGLSKQMFPGKDGKMP
jgi:CRISPR/Cas system CMR subunit Cmr6 (Cas7 group RAMP superfamily)